MDMERRLATAPEIEELFGFLAERMWEDSVKYADSIGGSDIQRGKDIVMATNMRSLAELYGDTIVMVDIPSRSSKLFWVNVINGHADGEGIAAIDFHSDTYIQVSGRYELLKRGDDYFNFESEAKKSRAGRPRRPSDDSVLKVHKVQAVVRDGGKIDKACKDADIAKSTYYRVSRWLKSNRLSAPENIKV